MSAEKALPHELKFDLVTDNLSLTRTMPTTYRIYTYRSPEQTTHDLIGGLILFGMMILFVGIMVAHFEIMILGSGIVMISTFSYTCFLEGIRQPHIFADENDSHSEVGADKDSL